MNFVFFKIKVAYFLRRDWNKEHWLVKTGSNWKKLVKKIFIIDKKLDGKEDKMKEKYLLGKQWTPVILLNCGLTQYDKWLVRNSWETFQTSHCGLNLSIKTLHSEKLLNVLFWNWNQCTAIMKRISVTWVPKRFFVGSINKFRT